MFLWVPTGKKFANICDESPDARAIESESFKNLTAGGNFTVNRKFKEPYMAKCSAKFIFATNSVLKVRDHTPALHRRLVIIPFKYKVTKDNKDVGLVEKLLEELPGIVNWSIEGLVKLKSKVDFSYSTSAEASKEEFIRGMDTVKAFIDERCVFEVGRSIESLDLYKEFVEYANENGNKPCAHKEFRNRLEHYHPEVNKIRSGKGSRPYLYIGVDLAT